MNKIKSLTILAFTGCLIVALSFACSDNTPKFRFGGTGAPLFEIHNLSNQYVLRGNMQLSRVDKRTNAKYELKQVDKGFTLTATKLSDEIRIDGVVSVSPVAKASDSIPITFELDMNGLATKASGFDRIVARLDSILGDQLADLPQSSEIFAAAVAHEVEEWNQRITPLIGKEAVMGNKFYFEKNLSESFGKVHCYFYAAVKRVYQTDRGLVAEVFVAGSNSITRLAFEVEEPADSIRVAFGLSDQIVDSLSALPVKVIRNAKRVVGVDNLLSYFEESTNTVSRREVDASGDTTTVRQITESIGTMYIDGAEALGSATPRNDHDIK